MKKFKVICAIILTGIIICGSASVIARNNEVNRNDIRAINAYLKSKIIFWQKLYDCTPYRDVIGTQEFKILEKSNRTCHVQIQGVDCYYPIDVAKKYSYNTENLLRKAIDDINSHGEINQANIQEEQKYIKQINYKYCRQDDMY